MNRTQIKQLCYVGVLFIIPLLLLILDIIPVTYRFFVLLAVSAGIIGVISVEKWSLKELGIRTDTVGSSALKYTLFTMLMIVGIIFIGRALNNNTQAIFNNPHFYYNFIILSFLQEFIFRSFLIPVLKRITSSKILIILINGILFGLMHVIFPNPASLVIFSSLLGCAFAAMYLRYPNLILIGISHSVINFVAVYFCFASFSGQCG